MPPSITRESQEAVIPYHDDHNNSVSPKLKQQQRSVSDFQARKKLLSSTGKKRKKKTAAKGSTSSQAADVVQEAAPLSTDESSAINSNTSNLLTGGMNTNTNMGMGMGMGGYGMMGQGGYGMYGGLGMGYGGMMGPLSGLNQFLFGIQATIFSLGQAVQVLGMNTHAIHQLFDTASSMVDHALATWHEMRALEATAREDESEEHKKRRRRLKALRWALVVASTYAAYRLLRTIFSARRQSRRRRLTPDPSAVAGYAPMSQNANAMMAPPHYSGYNSMSPYGSSYGGGIYGGGPYGGSFY